LGSLNGLGKPLLVGLVIRELIAPWTGHPFDFEIWVRLGVFLQSGGNPYSLLPYVPKLSFAPYPLMTSISYPPLPAFIFAATYRLYELLGSPSPFVYYFLLKQPMVVSDLLVGVLLFKLISLKSDPAKARRVAVLWIAFPFGIIVSSMWGALDPIALALVLGALYFHARHRPYLSAVFLGFGIYLKLMPLIFLPLFLMETDVSLAKKGAYAAVALIIPIAGTLIPFATFGWGYSGLSSAVSYQASLPSFGGMGIFNALSFVSGPSTFLTQALSLVWIAGLLVAYAYVYRKKMGLVEGSLLTVLAFSILRPVMPEQWALYPIAFLLLADRQWDRVHAFALAAVAMAFLLVNNVLLVRFFSPVSIAAFNWDQAVDNGSGFSEVRIALLFILSTFFCAEALSVSVGRPSFLASKLLSLKTINPGSATVPLAYLALVTLTGGILDFTATKMITDWRLAIQSDVFLGLSWLSLYHIMLVLVFETTVVLIVSFSRRSLSDSVGLFLLLTFLNFAASSLALVLYRALDGMPALTSTTIYLVSSAYVTERGFVVFAVTLGALGIFYLPEMRAALLILARGIAQITSKARMNTGNANNLPPPS
jgi:hypothetical protein